MRDRVEEEYRVNWKEELERRKNPGSGMYKFFSNMYDERAEIDHDFIVVYRFLTEKLNKIEKWEVELEKSQKANEDEMFTQADTVELSITTCDTLDTLSDSFYSKSSTKSEKDQLNLTAHSRIALLRMFMLKK